MPETVNHVLLTTVVKNAIRDLKTDPERTARNLIDMALTFADSRFQQQLYSAAVSQCPSHVITQLLPHTGRSFF